MQMKPKPRFRMTFISLFPENVQNVKVSTKNHNVLLFVQWTVVFQTMTTWKVKKFCWNVKHFYTTNNTKASIYAKLFLFLSQNKSYEKTICRSEEHTSELQSRPHLVCRLLLEKKNKK